MLIGEFARRLGVTVDTVRFYEKVGFFPDPNRQENGYRVYAEQDVEIGGHIAAGKAMGFSLREILAFTREMADGPLDHPGVQRSLQKKVDLIDAQIAALRTTRALVLRQIERCRAAEASKKTAAAGPFRDRDTIAPNAELLCR